MANSSISNLCHSSAPGTPGANLETHECTYAGETTKRCPFSNQNVCDRTYSGDPFREVVLDVAGHAVAQLDREVCPDRISGYVPRPLCELNGQCRGTLVSAITQREYLLVGAVGAINNFLEDRYLETPSVRSKRGEIFVKKLG
jgi:hypothetical protein